MVKAIDSDDSFTKDIFKPKHLSRIYHPNQIAAVELHRVLLNSHTNLLSSKDILENKVQYLNNFYVPSSEHLWRHTILNWQYNDSGMAFNNLSFALL